MRWRRVSIREQGKGIEVGRNKGGKEGRGEEGKEGRTKSAREGDEWAERKKRARQRELKWKERSEGGSESGRKVGRERGREQWWKKGSRLLSNC